MSLLSKCSLSFCLMKPGWHGFTCPVMSRGGREGWSKTFAYKGQLVLSRIFWEEVCKVCFDRDLGGNLSSNEWNETGPGERLWFCQRWQESNWQKSILVQDENGKATFCQLLWRGCWIHSNIYLVPECAQQRGKEVVKTPLGEAVIVFENVYLEPE